MKIHIKNGYLIDPKNAISEEKDLYIAAGKIVGVGSSPSGFSAEKTIDAKGLIIIPGLVDLSVHIHKDRLVSEMQAAMQGGVTSMVCSPDMDPILDKPNLVEMLKHRTKSLKQAHLYPLGALTVGLKGKELSEMVQLHEAGCIGFSQAEEHIVDTGVLLNAMEYASNFGYGIWLRLQDPYIGRDGVAHNGEIASRLGLPVIPTITETIRLYTIFELVRTTGTHIHLCRVSSASALELIRNAKKEGLPITCDVGIHHVHMTDIDIGFLDTNARMTPPFRSQSDRYAIQRALLDGTIDAICSDHMPVDSHGKLLPFSEAVPGATGLELLLSLTLKWAVESLQKTQVGHLGMAFSKVTSDPARVLGISTGQLSEGSAADICLFDPNIRWKVEPAEFSSQGKNTPFIGYDLCGRVETTIVSGNIKFERML